MIRLMLMIILAICIGQLALTAADTAQSDKAESVFYVA